MGKYWDHLEARWVTYAAPAAEAQAADAAGGDVPASQPEAPLPTAQG